MDLTADFIRSLSGLSAAELPDEVIDSLHVIEIAEDAAANYPDLSEMEALYYKGFKAITLLSPSLLLSVAETIKDNFNQFSRFDNVMDLLRWAAEKVSAVENPDGISQYNLLEVVVPDVDPIVNEAR